MTSSDSSSPIAARRWRYWPILIAFGLLAGWTGLMIYGVAFPNSYSQTIVFYPLVKLKAAYFTEMAVGLVCILIGLGLIFIWREGLAKSLNNIGLSLLVLGIPWVFSLGLFSFGRLPELDSLTTNEHLYHVVLVGAGLDDIKSYVVIECDSSGNWCRYISTPLIKSVGCKCFDVEVHLEIDPESQRLMLRVGTDIYDVMAHDMHKICHERKDASKPKIIDDQGNVCLF